MAVDVLNRLAGGRRGTLGAANTVAADLLLDPEGLAQAVTGMLHSDPVLAARCAHVVNEVARERLDMLQPFKAVLLEEVTAVPQWEVRELLCQTLVRLDLTPADVRRIFEWFGSIMGDKSGIVRTCAMQGMADLAAIDPGLLERAYETVAAATESGTPAMRARGRKLLAVFAKQRAKG